jgi:hypothetical protein
MEERDGHYSIIEECVLTTHHPRLNQRPHIDSTRHSPTPNLNLQGFFTTQPIRSVGFHITKRLALGKVSFACSSVYYKLSLCCKWVQYCTVPVFFVLRLWSSFVVAPNTSKPSRLTQSFSAICTFLYLSSHATKSLQYLDRRLLLSSCQFHYRQTSQTKKHSQIMQVRSISFWLATCSTLLASPPLLTTTTTTTTAFSTIKQLNRYQQQHQQSTGSGFVSASSSSLNLLQDTKRRSNNNKSLLQRNVASVDPVTVADMERGVGGRIEAAFEAAKEKNEAAFVTFITAGYPTAEGMSLSFASCNDSKLHILHIIHIMQWLCSRHFFTYLFCF